MSQLGRLVGGISAQVSGCWIRLPCGFVVHKVARRQGFLSPSAQAFPVSIIPPILHTRILLTCHRHHTIFVADIVLKHNTDCCHLNLGLRANFYHSRHCSLKAKCEFSRKLNWKKRFETWPARIPDLTPLLYPRGYVKQMALNAEICNTIYLRAKSKFKMWQKPNYQIDKWVSQKISQLHFMLRSNHVSNNAWKPHYGTLCYSVVVHCTTHFVITANPSYKCCKYMPSWVFAVARRDTSK